MKILRILLMIIILAFIIPFDLLRSVAYGFSSILEKICFFAEWLIRRISGEDSVSYEGFESYLLKMKKYKEKK